MAAALGHGCKALSNYKSYSRRCGHCKSLQPVWSEVGQALSGIVNVAAVDAEAHKSLAGNQPTFTHQLTAGTDFPSHTALFSQKPVHLASGKSIDRNHYSFLPAWDFYP